MFLLLSICSVYEIGYFITFCYYFVIVKVNTDTYQHLFKAVAAHTDDSHLRRAKHKYADIAGEWSRASADMDVTKQGRMLGRATCSG